MRRMRKPNANKHATSMARTCEQRKFFDCFAILCTEFCFLNKSKLFKIWMQSPDLQILDPTDDFEYFVCLTKSVDSQVYKS